jgi:hypothetical protein
MSLVHCFGVARVHERRATGRRGAIVGVVVRGSVRVIEAVVTPQQSFSIEDLRPKDDQRWRDLRRQLQQREKTRRQQWRFRKDPVAYLADIEARLLQWSLPFSGFFSPPNGALVIAPSIESQSQSIP